MTSSTSRRLRSAFAALIVAATGVVLVATPASAAAGTFTEYNATGFATDGAVGPDGNPWYIYGGSNLGTMDVLAPGAVTNYAVPGGSSMSSLTAGPDGQLWITDSNANVIRSFNLTTSVFTDYPLPAFTNPEAIVTGPDGQLWFVSSGNGDLTSFNIATSTFTSFNIGASSDAANAITVGADGLLWISRYNIQALTSFDIATSTTTSYIIPGGPGAGATSLAATADGLIWLNRINFGSILSFDPVASSFASFATSGSPYKLTVGSDGNVWFTTYDGNSIGTIAGGVPTEFLIPRPPATNYFPTVIFAPQDDNIWFYNAFKASIERFELPHAPVITTAVLPSGTAGAGYLTTLAATGPGPITWSISSGALPAGLTLNGATGVISGTPTVSGAFSVTIAADNVDGTDLQTLALTVAAAGALAATGLDAWGTASTALALLLLGGALMLIRKRRPGQLTN